MTQPEPLLATSRVVADFYRGIDFPAGWAEREATLDLGMAREHLFSAIVWLDANRQPLAACWRTSGGEDRFVRRSGARDTGVGLLDAMSRDLSACSGRLGVPDLLATMLWVPADVHPWQAEYVHREVFLRGRYSGEVAWSMAPRTMVERSAELVMMARRADDGLALPLPPDAAAMRAQLEDGDPAVMIVLPVRAGSPPERRPIAQLIVVVLLGIAALGLLLSAYYGAFR